MAVFTKINSKDIKKIENIFNLGSINQVKGIKKGDLNLDKFSIRKDLQDLINAGLSLSAASKYLAKKNGVKKSEIYNLI